MIEEGKTLRGNSNPGYKKSPRPAPPKPQGLDCEICSWAKKEVCVYPTSRPLPLCEEINPDNDCPMFKNKIKQRLISLIAFVGLSLLAMRVFGLFYL